MAETFNPYHKWLGIPPVEMPADCYRLLGIARFEHDVEVIQAAADQRTTYLKTYQWGKYAQIARRLQKQVAAAVSCLLDPEKRAIYDHRLRTKPVASQQLAMRPPARVVPLPPPVVLPPSPCQPAIPASLVGVLSQSYLSLRKKPSAPWVPWAVIGIAAGILALAGVAVLIVQLGRERPIGRPAARTGSAYLIVKAPAGSVARTNFFIDYQKVELPSTGEKAYELTPDREYHVGMARDGKLAESTFTLKAGDRVPFVPFFFDLLAPPKPDRGVPDNHDTAVALYDRGGLWSVEADLNGSTMEMVVDSGAQIVSLPWQEARRAGVDVSGAQLVAVGGIGGGGLGFQVVLPSLRVGDCAVRDVDCVVMPADAPPSPALLGQTFLSRADARIDLQSQRLVLRRGVIEATIR